MIQARLQKLQKTVVIPFVHRFKYIIINLNTVLYYFKVFYKVLIMYLKFLKQSYLKILGGREKLPFPRVYEAHMR